MSKFKQTIDDKHIKLLLFIFSVGLYATSLNHGFTLDDAMVLTENRFTQSADFLSILTQDTFSGFFTDSTSAELVEGGRYRPLSLLVFAVLWQLSHQPFIYHLINVLLFAVTVVLIFTLVKQLVKQTTKNSLYLAGLTALLFAVHPIHTEVVNNIKSLDEILSLLMSLMAWLVLLKTTDNNPLTLSKKLMAVMLFFLALMAKETALVFLPIIGLGFYVLQQHTVIKSIKLILPLMLGFGLYFLCRMLVIGDMPSAVGLNEPLNNPFLKFEDSKWVSFSLSEFAGTTAYVLNKYLYLLLFPYELTHDYYPHVIPITTINSMPALFAVMVHSFLLVLAILGSTKRKFWGFAISLYIIALMLFSNMFFNMGTFMAERFLYVPSLGFCMFLAWMMDTILPKNTEHQILYKHRLAKVYHGLIIVLISFGCYQLIDRSKDWKNNLSLLQADQFISNNSAKLQNALGGELTVQSQSAQFKAKPEEQTMLKEAIFHLDKAIELHPTYALAHMIKGNALHFQGNQQKSIESYLQALQINPNFTDAKNNLKKVQASIEIQQAKQSIITIEQTAFKAIEDNKTDQAILIFSQLIDEHNDSKHYFFRGVTFANQQLFDKALNDFESAEKMTLSSDSDNIINIWQALINVHTQLGNQVSVLKYQDKINKLKHKSK